MFRYAEVVYAPVDRQASRPAHQRAHGRVYVASNSYEFNSKVLTVFDAAGSLACSGTPKYCGPLWHGWASTPVNGGNSLPVVANGVVYVSDAGPNHDFFAFGIADCEDDRVCRAIPIGTGLSNVGDPAVANGRVFVSAQTSGCATCSTLFAFGL